MFGANKPSTVSRASTETTSLLTRVNQLVTQGLRQAAIDILEEALLNSPNDASLLRALGRIYILNHQPHKAVIYLRRSIAQSDPRPVYKDDYAPEDFTDADAEYIEDHTEEGLKEEFSLLGEFDQEEPAEAKQVEYGTRIPHLNQRPPKLGEASIIDGTVSQDKVNRLGRQKWNEVKPLPHQDLEQEDRFKDSQDEYEQVETAVNTKIAETLDADTSIDQENINGKCESMPTTHFSDMPGSLEIQAPLVIDDQDELESTEEFLDISNDTDNYLDIVDIDEGFEYDLDEIDPEIAQIEEIQVDDFDPVDSDWEDLDEFVEDASRDHEELAITGISREERARQVAVDVLERVGWDREYLPILESIFVESGWGATRIAIESQIERGAVPEQIVLAHQIRSIWFNNEYLWTSFRMKSNAKFMQAEAVYKNISWADALRLICCFASTPDESEVEMFIEDVFEEWYSSNRLRRHFHAFLKYLRYRIGASRRTLPGNLGFLFNSPMEADWGVDSPELLSELSEIRSELRELGADSGFEMPGIENKFKIIAKKELDELKDKK